MADPTLADVGFYYTGGGANSTPSLSIGGDISSSRIRFQSCTGLTTLTGVTLDDGLGNLEGVGTLAYTASSTSLTWTPYGGVTGSEIDVSTSGTYSIQAANDGGALLATVVAGSLPSGNVSNSVTVTNNTQKLFASQTKAESNAGVTKYHCFVIKNVHATISLIGVKLWLASNTNGSDAVSLYLDPQAAGDCTAVGDGSPTAVANENTEPSGSPTWVTPTSATHADVLTVGDLPAGDGRFFWIRQVTPSGVTTAVTENIFKLGLYIKA